MGPQFRTEVVPLPRARWERWYAAAPSALPSQSPAWQDAMLARGFRDASRALTLHTGREAFVLAVARELASWRLSLEAWPAAWCYGGAVLADGGVATPAEAHEVLATLASARALRARFVPDPRQADVWDLAGGGLAARVARTRQRTQALLLEDGFSTVWSEAFTRSTRQHVRVAQKRGVDISRGTSASLLEAFSLLYTGAQQRWGANSGQPAALARLLARRRDTVGQVRAVVERCGDEVTVWLASWRGQPVAAHVVVSHGEVAHDWLGAVDHDLARASHGSYLLQSRILEDACSRGRRWLNLGESDPGGPVEEHKRRLGAHVLDYDVLHLERLPVTAVATTATNLARTLLRPR